jgi:glycine/D-amino acid oxidase-like deaminating enzyme
MQLFVRWHCKPTIKKRRYGMTKISILPEDNPTNGWSAVLPPRPITASLKGAQKADWVVIGAGYAGLAAARRLAENRPKDKIILLEAHEVGEGASGRNSGFAIDLPHNVSSSLQELEGAHRFIRLSRAAINYLKDAVRDGDIKCDWSARGKYHAAVAPSGYKKTLVPFAKELDVLGEKYRWLDRDTLNAEIGTRHFHSALYTAGGYLLNPAALTRGLADNLPENVSLYEHTPVTAANFSGGVELSTPEGRVSAPTAILTVNGFATQFGFYKRALLTFASYASLTRPLSAAERKAMGGVDNWGLTPVNAISGVTMRLTQDRRILIRQRFRYAPSFRRPQAEAAQSRADHQRLFIKRFPMLPDVTMEHTWIGYVCMSRNHAPGFGRIAPRVLSAVCQNAVGVTKGTISGLLVADLACGIENPLIKDMTSLGTPEALPLRPFLDLGVRANLALEMWRGRKEK